MRKRMVRALFLCILSSLAVAGCNDNPPPRTSAPPSGSSDEATQPEETPRQVAPSFPTPRGGGHFVAWIQHHRGVFRSDDGRSWERVPGEANVQYAWTPSITAAGDGKLYATSMTAKPEVQASTDGVNWQPVPSQATEGERQWYAVCGGNRSELFMLTGSAQTFHSSDGGRTWTERGRFLPEGATKAGMGFTAGCAYDADGSRLVAFGSYAQPHGNVAQVSNDGGATWTTVPWPQEHASAHGILWAGNRILVALYDKVMWTEDSGQTWSTSTPAPLYSPNETGHGYNRSFASDGENLVVGIEPPSGAEGQARYHGGVFYSRDGGRTFEVLELPYTGDPTPTASDETIRVAFVPGRG